MQRVFDYISAQGHAPSGVEQQFLEKYIAGAEAVSDYEKEIAAKFDGVIAPVEEAPKKSKAAKSAE